MSLTYHTASLIENDFPAEENLLAEGEAEKGRNRRGNR